MDIQFLMLIAMSLLIVVELSLLYMMYSLRQEVIKLTAKLNEAVTLIFGKAGEQKKPFLQRLMEWKK